MAMLLAMFQKMKLVREKNQLMLEQTQYSSKLTRVQKNIENKQKYYTSILTKLDQQAKQMVNNYSMMFQQQFNSLFGTGMNYNMNNNIYGNYGMMGGVGATAIKQALAVVDNADAKSITDKQIELFLSGTLQQDADKNWVQKDSAGKVTASLTNSVYTAIQSAQNIANQSMYQTRQYQNYQMQSIQNNISIFTEMQKEQIEAEQDEVLGQLSYEETMLELEKEQRDIRLQKITAELDTYSQLVSQEAKNSAPTFGLG